LGNRRVAQLIQAKRLTPEGKIIGFQRKHIVSPAHSQYEQEADRVARQVVNTAHASASHSVRRTSFSEENKDQMVQTKPLAASITPFVQRQMETNQEWKEKEMPIQPMLAGTSGGQLQRQPETDEDKTKPIQAKFPGSMTNGFEAGDDVATQVSRSKGRGSPLSDSIRSFMEPRFGMDFSHVHVHTGSDAIQMNRDVGAKAFTHGSDIYYGAGYGPTNLQLTAHELTHVIQQTGSALADETTGWLHNIWI